jgi:hypothetical protein
VVDGLEGLTHAIVEDTIEVEAALKPSLHWFLVFVPMLIFLSYLIAPQPMHLVFTRGEVLAVILSTGTGIGG